MTTTANGHMIRDEFLSYIKGWNIFSTDELPGRILMLTALGLLFLDALITLTAVNGGTGTEANPLFSSSAGNPIVMFLAKAIVFAAVVLLSKLLKDQQKIVYAPYFLVIGMYIVVDLNNVLVLMH
jgi:hypothetical protein